MRNPKPLQQIKSFLHRTYVSPYLLKLRQHQIKFTRVYLSHCISLYVIARISRKNQKYLFVPVSQKNRAGVCTCLFYPPHQSNNQTSVFPPHQVFNNSHYIFAKRSLARVRDLHATLIENGLVGWNPAGQGVFHLLCVMPLPHTQNKMAPQCSPLLPDP